MVALSKAVAFANPNAPVYPRLAQGKIWDEVSFISLPLVSFVFRGTILQVQIFFFVMVFWIF